MNNQNVNHPNHYGGEDNPYEVIKVIEAWGLDFHLGNTVKYISRAGKKDPAKELEDLQKALWYLQRKIDNLQAEKEAAEAMTQAGCDLRQGMFEPKLEESLPTFTLEGHPESALQTPQYFIDQIQKLPKNLQSQVEDIAKCYEEAWGLKEKPVKTLAKMAKMMQGQIEAFSDNKDMFNNVTTLTMKDLEKSLQGQKSIELQRDDSETPHPFHFLKFVDDLPESLAAQVRDIARAYDIMWHMEPKPVRVLALIARHIKNFQKAVGENADKIHKFPENLQSQIEDIITGKKHNV